MNETARYDLVDRDGNPITVEPTLDEALEDAAARGLLHFSLSKLHDRAGMWQASTRWTWSGGYRVAIEPSAEEAAVKALLMQPVSDQRAPAPSPAAAGPEDIFA